MILASLVLVALLPQVVTTLEEGLELLEQGAEPTRVLAPAGVAAARAIEPLADDPEHLRRLAHLARLGKAHADLASALGEVVAARGPCLTVALAELGALPRPELDAAAARLSAESIDVLLGAIRDDEDPAAVRGAIALLVPRLPALTLADSLQTWAYDERDVPKAVALLEQLHRAAEPMECYTAVANVDLPPTLWPVTAVALRALLQRDPRVADVALEHASQGTWGPGCAVLHSLGGLWLDDEERLARATSIIDSLLAEIAEGGTAGIPPDAVSATITAGGDLLVPSVVPLLPALARDGNTAIRVAAINAMPKVCYRDAPTIDLLISLLGDPSAEVAVAAYEALRRKSGQTKLPMRVEMWTRWRESTELPATAPEQDVATRLEADRRLRAASARRARERSAR